MRWLIIVFLFAACSNKPEILSPEKMQPVLWDFIRADVYTREFIAKDSSQNAKYEHALMLRKIFAKHKTTRDEFFRSYDYYLKNPSELTPIFDSLISKQSKRTRPKLKIDTTLKLIPHEQGF